MITKQIIQEWFERGLQNENNTHLIVVCDTYYYEYYPVFVKSDEDIKDKMKHYSGNMQRIKEIYNLNSDMNEQLNQERSWNI